LLGIAYLITRRKVAFDLARSLPFLALAIFFIQQMVSAAFLSREELAFVVSNRASVLVTVLAGAVLVRQPDGRRALPALVVLGALASVPVMVHEVVDPDLTLFWARPIYDEARAGGLFAQANSVGCALSLAVAFLMALSERQALARHATAILAAAIGVGMLACASRGPLLTVIALVGIAWSVGIHRRVNRVPIATGLIIVGLLLVCVPPIGRALAALSQRSEDVGLPQLARLGEVASALGGDTDDLTDDDSSRSKLASEAWQLIGEKPLFGRGTHNFGFEERTGRNSHVQFLEVLGENGLVGGALYAVLLLALVLAAARLPAEDRFGAAIVLAAWIFTHFHDAQLIQYRFLVLPLAWIVGLAV
jgi:O-antigen ligase